MRAGTSTADAARMRALERENAQLRRVCDLAHGERFFRGRARPTVALVVAFIEPSARSSGRGDLRALRQAGVRIRRRGTTRPGDGRRRPGRSVTPRWRNNPARLKGSKERYGAWKLWDQLNREGMAAARTRGAADAGTRAARGAPRRYKVRTTRSIRRRTSWRTWWTGISRRLLRTGCGSRASPSWPPGRAPPTRVRDRRVRPPTRRVANRRQPQHRPGAGRAGDGGHLPRPPGR